MLDIAEDQIILNKTFADSAEALTFCGQELAFRNMATPGYTDSMKRRQATYSVYIGNFVALPHGEDDSEIINEGVLLIQVPDGVNFGTEAEPKIATLLFVVALKMQSQLTVLQELALFCSDLEHVMQLSDAQTVPEVLSILQQA